MRRIPLSLLLLLPACLFADSRNQVFSDFTTPLPVKRGDTLVIGVVGGWERWDNPTRCVRRTALVVRERRLPGVHVETVENHKLYLAEELVHRAFDFDGDGMVSREESAAARVIVFGQSLGGRAALRLCRTLDSMGIAVPLAIVVDSFGKDSYVVPPNVERAANWYQRDHLILKGAPVIRAADASRTRILGNWRVSDKGRRVDASQASKTHRIFLGAHARLEYDREVWDKVEALLIAATGGGG